MFCQEKYVQLFFEIFFVNSVHPFCLRTSYNGISRAPRAHSAPESILVRVTDQGFLFFYLLHGSLSLKKKNQTEEKAKVVAAGRGTALIQFLAALKI